MYNEDYAMPAMPEGDGIREGILRGMYKFKAAEKGEAQAQLFGSGPILNEAVRAQQILAEKYSIAADVWSVTSYNELRRDCARHRALEPPASGREGAHAVHRHCARRRCRPHHRGQRLHEVAARRARPWLGPRLVSLGTDGFGRSDNREHLRRHFEVDAESIVAATLSKLAREGVVKPKMAAKAFADSASAPKPPAPRRPDRYTTLFFLSASLYCRHPERSRVTVSP